MKQLFTELLKFYFPEKHDHKQTASRSTLQCAQVKNVLLRPSGKMFIGILFNLYLLYTNWIIFELECHRIPKSLNPLWLCSCWLIYTQDIASCNPTFNDLLWPWPYTVFLLPMIGYDDEVYQLKITNTSYHTIPHSSSQNDLLTSKMQRYCPLN